MKIILLTLLISFANTPTDDLVLTEQPEYFKQPVYSPSSTELKEEQELWAKFENDKSQKLDRDFIAHIKSNPKSPRASSLYAVYLAEIGKLVQANKQAKQASEKFAESPLPKLIEFLIMGLVKKQPGFEAESLVKKKFDQWNNYSKKNFCSN